jgi:hypothetical protein
MKLMDESRIEDLFTSVTMSVGAGVVEVVKLNVTTEDMKTILYLKKL